MNIKPYYIICNSLSGIETLVDDLIIKGKAPAGLESTTLTRPVSVVDYLDLSDTTSIMALSEDEANILKKDERVIEIHEKKERQIQLHALPPLKTQRIIDDFFISNNNSVSDNWGLTFCSTVTAVTAKQFNYYYTGSGVNVVIIDTGIIDGHPEWNSAISGQSRLQMINWSLFYPLTSVTNVNVTVGPKTGGGHAFYFNGQERPIWYVPNDINLGAGSAFSKFRTTIYKFNLDGTTTASHPFYIGNIEGFPNNYIVNNNGATSGTVTLSVFSVNNPPAPSNETYFSDSIVYYCGIHFGMGNLIKKTKYNTQSSNYYTDTNGHGTHCTGTVAGSSFGWAKESNIYSINIFNNGISTFDSYIDCFSLAKSLYQSTGRPTVTNNSWGFPVGDGYYSSQQPDADYAVKDMTDAGVHFIHSAGNDTKIILTPYLSTYLGYTFDQVGTSFGSEDYECRESSPHFPYLNWGINDSLNPGWCVGALGFRSIDTINNFRMIADYSNFGSGITVYTPGSWIQSAWPNTAYATYRDNASYGVRKISGTSMAGPQVAGILATYLQYNSAATPLEAKNYLLKNTFVDGIYYNPSLPGYSIGNSNNLTLMQFPQRLVYYRESSNCIKYNDICYTNTGLSAFNYADKNTSFPVSAENINICSSCLPPF